jgi:hypothetical protein
MSEDLTGFVRKSTPIIIGTKEFIFKELSLKDFAEFRAHLIEDQEKINSKRRQRLLADSKEVGTVVPIDLLKLLDNPISEEELEKHSYTIEGIGYLAYLSLRYAMPGISRDQVMEIISLDKIEEITKAMFPVSISNEVQKKMMTENK